MNNQTISIPPEKGIDQRLRDANAAGIRISCVHWKNDDKLHFVVELDNEEGLEIYEYTADSLQHMVTWIETMANTFNAKRRLGIEFIEEHSLKQPDAMSNPGECR